MRCAHEDSCFESSAFDSVHCCYSLVMSIRSYFKPKSGLPDPDGSLSTCLPTQALRTRQWRRLGKKRGQYFIFMVASDAASSFILFHTGPSLELLE